MANFTDVIIIGGGAGGLCSAVYLKQNYPHLSVRLLEGLPRVGKKLSITGNGRCNITNKEINLSRYHGEEKDFAAFAITKYDRAFCEAFFSKIGVPFVYEDNKAFPYSLQASSVVDCLRFTADNLGVITNTETKVTNIQIEGGNYKIIAGNLNFLARNVIIATGLFSGTDRLGCDGSMLEILKKAGFKTVNSTPSLVQIKTETDIVKQLKGVKCNALVTLKSDSEIIRSEYGETLFCDYGLSGPPVLQVSREVARRNEKLYISLDIMPEISLDSLVQVLTQRMANLSHLCLDEFFTGMLQKRLGQVIIKASSLELSRRVNTLRQNDIMKIAKTIKSFDFAVTGNTGFANSQVTAGGLKTSQFDPKTMMSKTNKGLYCIGEILDIDGDCGGFNLQWAWSSAFCACDSIGKA